MVYLHEGKAAGIAGGFAPYAPTRISITRLAMRLYSGSIRQAGTEEKVAVQNKVERPAIKIGNSILGADGGNSDRKAATRR